MMLQKKAKCYNPNWPQIPDHPYRILIIASSGTRKTNALLNLVNDKLLIVFDDVTADILSNKKLYPTVT